MRLPKNEPRSLKIEKIASPFFVPFPTLFGTADGGSLHVVIGKNGKKMEKLYSQAVESLLLLPIW